MELLDEITKLAFYSQLPPEINGHSRNTLIRQFRAWKGLNYVPENLHPSIKWSEKCPNPLAAEVQDIPWQIVNRKEHLNSNLNNSILKAPNAFVTAKGSMPLQYKTTSTEHKADNQGELHAIKKLKTLHKSNNSTSKRKNEDKSDGPRKKQKFTTSDEDDAPHGSQWDGDNYSCAYDALFTILFNIWVSNPKKWKKNIQRFQSVSVYFT